MHQIEKMMMYLLLYISYTMMKIEDLNKLLNAKCSEFIREDFNEVIEVKGEIIDCSKMSRIFDGTHVMNFKIKDGDNYKNILKCKAWERYGIDLQNIVSKQNTTCIVSGHIKMNQWNVDREFVLELDKDIVFDNDDSKIRQLISDCEAKGYFTDKKPIIWNNIRKIGILSKENTQGYNDFMTQFMIPFDICYKEITLEGPNTASSVIQAIEEMQEIVDIMIIIRGGGSTSDISNSFDRIEIFDAMKNSSVPVMTAIGHEADKGDKLLITSISDHDFPTPSRAATEMNKIFIDPCIQKINSYSQVIMNYFQKAIQEQRDNEYMKLNCYIEQVIKDKFGGRIISLDDNETIIILQKDGRYYKQEIQYTEEISITPHDIALKNKIEQAIYHKDMNKLQESIYAFIKDSDAIVPLIQEVFLKFKSLDKTVQKFENCAGKKSKTLYCKEVALDATDMKTLIRLNDMYKWYKNVLEALENRQYIKEIMKFIAY